MKKRPTGRVLIVEDQVNLAKGFQKMLEELNYKVVGTVQTGPMAIQKAKSLKPDLVLMDIVLKGKMNGIHAAKKIKGLSIPVIFMTAYADEERIMEAKETDPFGYIVKPFKKEELEAVIEISLQKRKKELKQQIKSNGLIEEAKQETANYLDLVGSIVVVLDPKGKIVLINKKGYKVLGYKQNELEGESWFKKCIPKDSQKEVEDVFISIVKGKIEPVEFWENEIIRKNGERRMISWHNTSQRNEKGEIVRILSSGEDITKQREVSLALKKSEERYRIVTEQTGTLVYDYNADTGKISWLGAVKEVTGFSPKEFSKVDIKVWMEMVHPDDRKRAVSELKKARNTTGHYNAEYRFKHKKGHYIHIEEHGVFLTDSSGRRTRMLGAMKDITEQKEAHIELEKSEAKYRTIFENTGTANCIIESDTTISLANTVFAELSGYKKEEVEGKKKWTEFVTPEFLKLMKKYHLERRRPNGKAPKSYEFDFINAKKEKKSVLLFIDMIPGTSKSVASLLDITEQKKTAEKLVQSEQKYRSITENAQEMIAVVQDGKFVLTNPRLYEVLGYTTKDVRTMKSFAEYIHPKDRILVFKRYMARLVGMNVPSIYSFRIINKQGKTIWVEINATKITWEGKSAILVLMEDVSEKKKKELELKKFALGFEQSGQIIFTTNTDGVIEYINPQFTKTYGYKKEEVIGKTPRIIKSGIKDKEFYKDFWNKLLSKKPFRIEVINKTKTGKYITISASLSPILDEKNELKGFMAIQTDITKQMEAEKTLKEKVEQMEFMGRTNLKRHKRMMELEKENRELRERIKNLKK